MMKAFLDWHKQGQKYRLAYATAMMAAIYQIYYIWDIPLILFLPVPSGYFMLELLIMALDLILKIRGRR